MKTITIITPANIEVEYRLAGAGSRLAAFLIDLFLQLLIIGLIALIVLRGFAPIMPGTQNGMGGTTLAFVLISFFAIHFGYFILSELIMNGQTIGKSLFGLRVIRDNGQPIEFIHALVRGVFRTAADMLYVGLFVMMFSSRHKRLGDMAAGTIVISEHYEQFGESTFAQTPIVWPDFFLQYEDRMTEDERQLTEEWLQRRERLPRKGADIGEQLRAYFKEKYKEEIE